MKNVYYYLKLHIYIYIERERFFVVKICTYQSTASGPSARVGSQGHQVPLRGPLPPDAPASSHPGATSGYRLGATSGCRLGVAFGCRPEKTSGCHPKATFGYRRL
jgi:hypothetical protein